MLTNWRENSIVLCQPQQCIAPDRGTAAKEMRERFLKFTGQTSTAVTFGTFHGVFYGILKQAYGLGAGNILSEEEKYAILKEMTLEFGQELAQEGDFQVRFSRFVADFAIKNRHTTT